MVMSRVSVCACALVAVLAACAGVAADHDTGLGLGLDSYENIGARHIHEEKLRALCEFEHSTSSCIELFFYQYRLPLIIGGAVLALIFLICIGCCICCCCRKRYHTVSQA